MPWCPKCKYEYVEGMTVCADCGSQLVDSLDEVQEPPKHEEPIYEAMDEMMEEEMAGEDAEDFPELPEDAANAVHMGRMMQQLKKGGVYEDATKKAEEFKSGAYTLIIVGVLGLLALGLLISGVLPVRLDPSSQFLMCLVMAFLFIVFIVMGVLSFKSYQTQASKAVRESALKDELVRYCMENMDTEEIDRAAGAGCDDPDEIRYFKRTEEMRRCITEHFLNLEEGYLDNFIDEIYPKIFTEN